MLAQLFGCTDANVNTVTAFVELGGCNGNGVIVLSGSSGTCTCASGYTGANCNDCIAATHQRYPGSADCVAKSGIVACPSGEYSLGGACEKCPAGNYSTYPSGRGFSPECTPCPDGQTAPVGSGSVTACFFQFQVHGELDDPDPDGYCTGTGSDARGSVLSLVTSKADCQSFAANAPAEAGSFTFLENTAPGNVVCADDATSAQCRTAACADRAAGVQVGGQFRNWAAACRITCGTCGTPATRCVIDADDTMDRNLTSGTYYVRRVRYFDPASSPPMLYVDLATNAPLAYTPVCTAFFCPQFGFDVLSAATADGPPRCTAGDAALSEFEADETGKNAVFFYVALPVSGALTVAGYWYKSAQRGGFSELERRDHAWVWLGLTATVLDMMSDWATLYINLGDVGEQNRFYYAYDSEAHPDNGGDADAIRRACLAFAIFGAVLTPIDVIGAYRRSSGESDGRAWILFATVGVTLFEDVPQLAINSIYIDAMDGVGEGVSAAIAVVSMITSVAMIIYKVWLITQHVDDSVKL